ncbi:TIR domain-containing protein [Methylobacter tundripaludum]|uniref:non-specific serine/threonine protein kinase n=1 Tax=Methylobacter tundripaludum TaxID=173365 RepID=A0A2S6GTT6_9GAMM|nr:COR domain-containing protein [Methylobacter tundripaludum]PPK68662.1 TIR domain-containing protein [Methylobacter tundripaludum]
MSELALRLIAENKKTRATFLDLGNCGLTEVPDEIGELVWLEGLSFAGEWRDGKQKYESQNTASKNNIAWLSGGFRGLKQLKRLFLNGVIFGRHDLIDLSPLASLNTLQLLDINTTEVASLSPLANLTGLHRLDIGGTQVTDLSPLVRLSGLRQLIISLTEVTDLRPLATLGNLQQLDILGTPVTDLSPLAILGRLKYLEVSNTRVVNLSPLKRLSSLQQFYALYTQIADLSPLANLRGLKQLNVSGTQIMDLSPLANLGGLKGLDVSYTKVTDLRPLANLEGLQQLNVLGTQVTDIKILLRLIEKGLEVKWSSDYWNGNGIYVKGCPLINPPVAIAQQGNAAILNYFREKQAQGTDHIYEAKLLLVGEGGAGKTSLLRRLYQPALPLPEENETTKGIAIHRHEFEVRDARYPNGRMFRLNVWDFGGQEIYHATHQFFLTQRSLYVLLDDTRKDHKTLLDEGFKYWLEAVDLLSSHSPVLIFQNEKGGRSKSIDLAGIKGGFDNVKDCYRGNLEQQDVAEPLRTAIEFFAQNLPHIGEELPARWLDIRADIEQLAELQATITQNEYFDLYRKHLPFDRDKALHLSRYLHDLGVFLHFQDDKLLARTVILQNQWATTAVFKMLDDETVKAQLGRFTAGDCARLWQDSDYRDMHPELLALMQKFELCYALPDTRPETWLAPQLLPPSKPEVLNDWAKPGDLVLRFCYEFLPKGMVSRLMVRQHYFVQQPELAWMSGALFERDETQVLVEIPPKGGEIVLRARGVERKELLSVLAADLDKLNNTFNGLAEKVTKLIPCHCKSCRLQTEPEFFGQKQLLKRKKDGKLTIECPASYEDVRVLELLDGIQVHKMPDWGQAKILPSIFISYSKHDNDHKDTLIKHLAGLRNNMITWNDRDLLAGEEWDTRIKQELHQADIVLYLVSHHSMATDYIQNVELPLIEELCKNDECKLVPIIVDFCLWEKLDFAKYNALPNKGEPVTNTQHWVNENQAWLEVVKGIERLLN